MFTEFLNEQYTAFLAKRNTVLYGFGALLASVPHHAISAVPRSEDVKRGTVITHGMIGHGAFGRVSPAVHAYTGEPLAVKQHLPTNKRQLNDIALEANIGLSSKV